MYCTVVVHVVSLWRRLLGGPPESLYKDQEAHLGSQMVVRRALWRPSGAQNVPNTLLFWDLQGRIHVK